MGYNSARDFAAIANIDIALMWHLSSNHYPPLPTELIATCKAALEAVGDDEPERSIELPDGMVLVNAHTGDALTTLPASEVVEYCHLDAFLDELTA